VSGLPDRGTCPKSRRLLHHHPTGNIIFIAFDVAEQKNCGYIIRQHEVCATVRQTMLRNNITD
jgi:hypothetical protein